MSHLAVALVLLLLGTVPIAAQAGTDGREYSLGIGASIVNDPPVWFTNAICPDEHPTRYTISAGARLRGPLTLRAVGSRYSHNPELCINGLIPPIPETGPYTARGSGAAENVTGYPFWTLEAHLGVESYLNDALLGRVTVGSLWIPTKDISGIVGSIGTGLRIPGTPLVATLAFEQQWLTIPYVDSVVEYLDGAIEDVRITPRTDHVTPSLWSLGVELWW